MATFPDSALPDCTNPQHPQGLPKRMQFLQYIDHAYVFGCQACKDVNRKMSVRVMTDQFLKREARRKVELDGRALRGPMQRRPRSSFELGIMREMTIEARMRREAARAFDWDDHARRTKDGRYELVEYRDLGNGAVQIQMAIDGKLCPQMDDHIASREEFRTEKDYWQRVARGSETMLHLYGDARHPLTPEESAARERETF